MAMTVKEAADHIRNSVRDSAGAGVWTAQFFCFVLADIGEEDEEPENFEQALDMLVAEGVMERVGRNGYQVREDWLEEQGTSVEELGT